MENTQEDITEMGNINILSNYNLVPLNDTNIAILKSIRTEMLMKGLH